MASTTEPSDWFLSTVPYTLRNTVSALVDGKSYFEQLKSTVQSLSSSPYWMISGWRVNPNSFIDPENQQSIAQLITETSDNHDLTLRSMLWYVPGSIGNFAPGHGQENLDFTRHVINSGGQAILDNRLPTGRFSSHHQKFSVVGSSAGHVAFVGGIDIAPDRWDTTRHDSSALRDPEFFLAWHDVQAKIVGPAVADVWNTFQQRWNDPRPPHHFPSVGNSVPPQLGDGSRPSIDEIDGATHAVQVLKTYACKSNSGNGAEDAYPFARSGDYSYRDGLIKAINNAERYIYVEDQYFWPCATVDALAEAVRRGVCVVLLLARDYDVEGFVPHHNFLRDSALRQLTEAEDGTQRVFVYHLEQAQVDPETSVRAQIYVHSKTVIIDDRYAVIGSANINRRSMTTDSELGVAIVDTEAVDSQLGGQSERVGRFARNYRRTLWSEHLGQQSGDDPLTSDRQPAGFPTGNSRVGHVRVHSVGQPRFCQPSILPFGLMNSRTTCNG